jgi:nicotinamidase-related amidase
MNGTALLVIDVQSGLVEGAHNEACVLSNINQVISKTRASGGLIVFIQHCHSSYKPLMKGNSGWQVHPSLSIAEGDLFIEKSASDSFYQTSLHTDLESRGIDHLIVTGLQSEYCVDTTCRSALSKGYSITLVSDAHTTGDSHMPAADIIDHHNQVLQNLAHPDANIQLKTASEI